MGLGGCWGSGILGVPWFWGCWSSGDAGTRILGVPWFWGCWDSGGAVMMGVRSWDVGPGRRPPLLLCGIGGLTPAIGEMKGGVLSPPLRLVGVCACARAPLRLGVG